MLDMNTIADQDAHTKPDDQVEWRMTMSTISMKVGGFQKWFAVTVASTEPDTHVEGSKFNQLINDPEWNPDKIDVKIVLNGIEFDKLDDIFLRVDNHIQKEAENLAQIDVNNQKKMDAIQDILNGYFPEDD